jgi:predicted transcriptional regulator
MSAEEKLLGLVENNPAGVTDKDAAAELDFKYHNQANAGLSKLANEGKILRYKPEGSKTIHSFPVESLQVPEKVQANIAFITSITHESADDILYEAIEEQIQGSSARESMWKGVAQNLAKTIDRSLDSILTEAVFDFAKKHEHQIEWKDLLIAKVNAEQVDPSKVIEEAIKEHLYNVTGNIAWTTNQVVPNQ